ncbi:hypothetical protein EVJ58_g2078 [Rhodofomes roseus]|uniref:Uncharacterized protein n=1 Tax=Rhodofomes roseus TaxID=34475 RepID=A0A4Y9YU80_9APHY|nr:hypothetical protein EVJ58_g2078 [Rhodofomes roseus]
MEDFLLYLPSSPAVEGTAALVGDLVDGTAGVVGDLVDTIRNSAALASPEFIWLSDMSLSDIGYGSVYFDLDFVLVDTLGGVDMANGTGDRLDMDFSFVVAFDDEDGPKNAFNNTDEGEPDAANLSVNSTKNDEVRNIVNLNSTEKAVVDVTTADDDSDDGLHTVTEYEMLFILVAVSIYCVPAILLYGVPPVFAVISRLPIIDILVDDIRSEFSNPRLYMIKLMYVLAGLYLAEEALLGPLFGDPFVRIRWLMEHGWIDTMFLAQDFMVLYLWAWWKLVVPTERARALDEMGLAKVPAFEEWVLHNTDGGAHRRCLETGGLSDPWARKVLKSFDKAYNVLLYDDKGTAAVFVKPETTVLFGDLD